MRSHPLGPLDGVLPLPGGPLPKASIGPRLQTVGEAKGWPKGADRDHQSFVRLYEVGDWELGFGKPGKEAFRKKKPNANDMVPTVWHRGLPVSETPALFEETWAIFEGMARSDEWDALEVCARLLFRNAYLLDHGPDARGHLRYAPPPVVMDFLAGRRAGGTSMTLDVLHHFIELIALNEDVKYSTIKKTSGAPYDLATTGRPTSLITALHFILTLFGQATMAELVAWTSRGRGVSTIRHEDARNRLLACSA